MKKDFRLQLHSRRLYFDGGTGTVLQARGLLSGEAPENWNLTHPEEILSLHRAYLDAGCHIIKSNTFGVNSLKYPDTYGALIDAAMALARRAVEGREDAYIAFDVGPLGRLLEPLGTLPFEKAVAVFSDGIRLAEKSGADLILIETMNDSYETKAAVLAAKEVSSLPVVVTNAYDESEKLMTGASPEAMVALLEGLSVDALGANCSFGPDKMLPLAKRLAAASSLPLVMNPNAGLPTVENGRTVFTVSEEDFASSMAALAEVGVTVLGGCCGTTPSYLEKTVEKTKDIPFSAPTKKSATVVASYTHALVLGEEPHLIGERINPTGKPKLKEALRRHDMGYLLEEAVRQEACGVSLLDVNVGLPEIDEPAYMAEAVKEIQAVTDLPLQIDSSDPRAIEQALRLYNGKAMVNSVNGETEKLRAILPLVKKYGGTVVCLTMDENGIPTTAEGRVAIAHKIERVAAEYGLSRKELVFDPLALSVSSDADSARITLEAVRRLHDEGYRTVLGVSNISFGLPKRELVNATFFAQALQNGLSLAIVNPFASGMLDTYYAHLALSGKDVGCKRYIAYADGRGQPDAAVTPKESMTLAYYVVKGMAREAAEEARRQGQSRLPLALIEEEIVPALNEIGRAFEEKKAYLPQLLMSAEAANAAFSVLKELLPKEKATNERAVILATVKGDIHDIGKNIVRVLLESYGFTVYDLGKDVSPDAVCEAVEKTRCRLVGLSALMTTTVPSMEETVRRLKARDGKITVMVGGAVMNAEYASRIGADLYAPDAMGAVRMAEAYYREKT